MFHKVVRQHMQGSVGFLNFNIHLTRNLPGNLPVKIFFNLLRFDRIVAMSLWPTFWPTVYRYSKENMV